ncbi:hypothetical protein SAY86_009729 [Trapa natans]|uniref:Uncharacterized protein n=1 Tax=Trapa natans TaxID=22666 RepID=A0AAN7L082_TRANT|nr:hypothetical protein SAY86_009729 [Trapa natans]
MEGSSSQVIMGATLVLAASLVIVLSLVLVLLAELYCSILVRRWRGLHDNDDHHHHHLSNLKDPSSSSAAPAPLVTILSPSSSSVNPSSRPSPLSSFYAHGVLRAPRSLLFPHSLPSPEIATMNLYAHSREVAASATASTPSKSFIVDHQEEECSTFQFRPSTSSGHPMYISNPVYDSDATDRANAGQLLDSGGSSSGSGADDERERDDDTPPLTPMKDLPAQASSVPLRDARSLYTSVSDSNTNHGLLSSFSSGTPCTSFSW